MKTRMTSAGPQKVPALDVLNNFCSEARRVESSEKRFLLSSVRHSTRFHNLEQSRVAERASHKCALSPFLLFVFVPNSNFELENTVLFFKPTKTSSFLHQTYPYHKSIVIYYEGTFFVPSYNTFVSDIILDYLHS